MVFFCESIIDGFLLEDGVVLRVGSGMVVGRLEVAGMLEKGVAEMRMEFSRFWEAIVAVWREKIGGGREQKYL